jgi:hypothetical protein
MTSKQGAKAKEAKDGAQPPPSEPKRKRARRSPVFLWKLRIGGREASCTFCGVHGYCEESTVTYQKDGSGSNNNPVIEIATFFLHVPPDQWDPRTAHRNFSRDSCALAYARVIRSFKVEFDNVCLDGWLANSEDQGDK